MSVPKLITLLLLMIALGVRSQNVICGVVTDRQTGKSISHVSVVAEGNLGQTVTNDDGRFVLKTSRCPSYVKLSHIGYRTLVQAVKEGETDYLKLVMTSNSVTLDEVVVSVDDPLSIIKAAMSRIPQNYPQDAELMNCFYRETSQRGSRFISIAEAVTEMYKTGYGRGTELDAVAILKGRRLMNMKVSDTLGVKIQGGPVMPLVVDIAKNHDYLLNDEDLSHCEFHMEVPAKIDNRLHYVVRVVPQQSIPYPLMGGKLYVDCETLTFSRADLQLDMSNSRRAAEYMLVSKPLSLRFRPKELTMTVVYHTDSLGKTRMSYLRNVMRFNCDWKRRLFASSFTTVSEMVVTEYVQHDGKIRRPRGRSTFGLRDRFYDRVEYFDDPLFWADYNIIEPTESLEHAIDKLKKRLR